MSALKIVNTKLQLTRNTIFMINQGPSIFLVYRDDNGRFIYLNNGGSPKSRLIKCSDLKRILSSYFIKGTKFITSIYNPTLYYLFPGNSSNDILFNSDNDFIPMIPTMDLSRREVDGFDMTGFQSDSTITQRSVRSIKACDNWYDNLSEYQELDERITERVNNIFGYYKSDFDVEKEIQDKIGSYSADVSTNSIVVTLTSETTYTDTINLEDWVYKSGKDSKRISGKLDISYMYSIGGQIYSGMQTIKAFQYEEYLTSTNRIIDLGKVQLEYMNYVLKIYPLLNEVDEAVISDCTLTIGVL